MSAMLTTPLASIVHNGDAATSQDGGDWGRAVASEQFSKLMETKLRCVAPLLLGSFAFLVALTLLAGYAKGFMAQKVVGSFNVGYLLVVATYVVCWAVSVIYVRIANRQFEAQSAIAIGALNTRRSA